MAGRLRFSETSYQRSARLKAAGLWDEFSVLKAKLIQAGQTAKDADWEAWGRFPPPEDLQPEAHENLPLRLPAAIFAGKPEQSDRDALKWALDHMVIEDVNPEDCPSPKAWLFFIRGRLDPEFCHKLALAFAPTKAEQAKAHAFHDDGRDLNERLAKIRQHTADTIGALPVLLGGSQGRA